ncbi:MAG: urease accessory protein UreF [Chromatiales bacterium]|nr:urease accessory protein UreF [Chromatiales bacterium]
MSSTGTSAPPSLATLRLWQLVSPALPVGAYAYSEGLEQACADRLVHDAASAEDWIVGQLEHVLASLDVGVLGRTHQAFADGDLARARRWSAFLLASRESAELLAADRHLGQSLARLLVGLEVEGARRWVDDPSASFAAMFALAATRWDIPLPDAAGGYLFAWLENQVTAAVKLVPLGQTAGQRILLRAADRVACAVRNGLALVDDELGSGAPGVALASMRHETLYSRLFRS